MSIPELTIIIPAYNERDNIQPMVERLHQVLDGIHWEVIFVDDDSPDGTFDKVREQWRADPRVRGVLRLDRRGLSSACVEGVLASNAPVFAVMDGDLQHDETILPEMYRRMTEEGLDLVMGSRHVSGGKEEGLANAQRRMLSDTGNTLARWILPRPVSDPMSGFFMMRRAMFDRCVRGIHQDGFKILMELIMTLPPESKTGEVPYTFRKRLHGESKLDARVMLEFGAVVVSRLSRGVIPPRFVLFGLVGGSGIVVHYLVLTAAYLGMGLEFLFGHTGATLVAMVYNFILNNRLTFRDRRLKGSKALMGLLGFVLVSTLGAVANIGIANLLFLKGVPWWLAAFAGILVGSVWNYLLSSRLVWK